MALIYFPQRCAEFAEKPQRFLRNVNIYFCLTQQKKSAVILRCLRFLREIFLSLRVRSFLQ